MMTHTSSIGKKAGASFVNCVVVFVASLPVYWVNQPAWKSSTVLLFFAYNMIFRDGCLGMRAMGTMFTEPVSLSYVLLYTLSFASLLYHVVFTLDLALLNGLAVQLPCLLLTGNTAHGLLSGSCTIEESYHERQVQSRDRTHIVGQVPRVRQRLAA